MIIDMVYFDGRGLLFFREREMSGKIIGQSLLALVGLGFLCYTAAVWLRRRSVLILSGMVVGSVLLTGVLLFAVFIGLMYFSESTPNLGHTYWHDCRDNCNLFDDAKRICAEKRGLTNGTAVTWQDVQPFFTNSVEWGRGRYHVTPAELPKCPAGGTYTLNPVGYWSMCSVPYHQWANCIQKKSDHGGWREYEEPGR